jgi:hypothetical protein
VTESTAANTLMPFQARGSRKRRQGPFGGEGTERSGKWRADAAQ